MAQPLGGLSSPHCGKDLSLLPWVWLPWSVSMSSSQSGRGRGGGSAALCTQGSHAKKSKGAQSVPPNWFWPVAEKVASQQHLALASAFWSGRYL